MPQHLNLNSEQIEGLLPKWLVEKTSKLCGFRPEVCNFFPFSRKNQSDSSSKKGRKLPEGQFPAQ
ncbi:hypothetical protein SAMN03080598_00581 [Algoriphagus boritolerans DSM 17298 = JCM 18970]|uniref:Uncharacterized protein n=1 Tax=Algoriphagus boritolerans DSM 17298 = JCM 18970 TaxID=1120964 RepID=A0A1H5SZU6_9BACT|nr:hypothetical protein SAMN03080598_00581 [Algoriphagus boritolerans DSM 17298 = JCM 18970]